MEKAGRVKPKDGLDVNHIKPLSKGGAVGKGNLEAIPTRKNRSFKRNPDGSMK
ncbi:MAG: HNH endonuclease signature motif containing protein [Ktedonobacteraceae bacterium]